MKQTYYHNHRSTNSNPLFFTSFLLGSLLLGLGVISMLFTTAPITASAQEVATSTTDVTVTIVKFIEGSMATASSGYAMQFPMEATWDSVNLGAGTGAYTLSPEGYNGDPTPYQAVTSPMTTGADYATHEVTGTGVDLECDSESTFALIGYSTGNTLAAAMTGTVSTEAPMFTDMTTDKFVIVWNDDCTIANTDVAGPITGVVVGGASSDGALAVTSIDRESTTATANNSYTNGWRYRFHITVPMNESELSMRFSDWMHSNMVSVLPVANNMRISSMQASATSTVTLTGSNVYSNPDLQLITDLDVTIPGRQIEVLVEVKIPTTTVNGNYSTTYGVRSLTL